MDFMNRGQRGNQPTAQSTTQGTTTHSSSVGSGGSKKKKGKAPFNNASVAGKVGFLVLLVVLVALALLSLIMFKGGSQESRLVNNDQNQAVFLNGGQVYFGKINKLNKSFLQLSNVYYLRVNQQVQPDANATANDISLVKLGCELHGPQDEMVINREQVIFWENLKNDGQVAEAIEQFKKEFPNGQDCSEQASTPAPAQNNANNNDSQAGDQPANREQDGN